MSAVRAIGVAADHSLTQNLTQRRQELANTEAALRQQRETLALSATAVESLRKAEFQLNSERLSVRILGQARHRLESHLRSIRRHLQAGRVQDALADLTISQLGPDFLRNALIRPRSPAKSVAGGPGRAARQPV